MRTSRSWMAPAGRILSAYPTLLRVGFAAAVAYRAEMLIWMLTTTMPLVSLALWSAVAAEAPVGRFGPSEFTAYFLAALVIRQVTGSWLVWEMNREIKTGELSQRLLRPMHPLVTYSAENLGAIPLRMLLTLPIAVILVATGGRVASSPEHIGVWAISLLGAWLINFFTMALIGALAFYLESSTAVFEVWLMTFMILSGYVVPLELFPGWVRAVAEVLPFRYTLGYPTEVIVGLLDRRHVWQGLVVQWAYVAATATAALVVWKAGLRRFSAFGG